MIRDRVRMDAYAEAIRRAVAPGSVVLDIGTGTGFMAILAERAGARRVIAVDPSPLVSLAREAALVNGVGDVVEVHQEVSTALDLDEPVDVIVSDLRGRLPLLTTHLTSIIDARDRLLRNGGVLIPA